MNGFALSRDAHGTLRFSDGTHHDEPVTVTPSFPSSDPGRWLSLRKADGTELALIEDPAELPAIQRQLVIEQLKDVHFAPVITRIDSLSSTTEGLRVQLETDRGRTTVFLDGDEHIYRITDARIVLIDTNGVRYLIPDVTALDRASRHRLERFY